MSNSRAAKLTDEIGNARRLFKNGMLIVRNSMLEISAAKTINIKPLYELVNDIISSLNRNQDALLFACRHKPKDDYTTAHALSTCIYIAAFCRHLKLDDKKARDITIGALLGDVGKLRVSKETLDKPGSLTEKEFLHVKKHAKYTYALLYASKTFSETTIRAATEHHERLDGTGYPFGLADSDISRGGLMTAIADVYDALVSPRVYQKAKEHSDVFKIMQEAKDSQFKSSMLKKFIQMVGVYPVGSMVALSNAKIAVVVDHGESDIHLPKVKTIFDLRKQSLIRGEESIELEELNAKAGLNIIRPLAKNEINLNPIALIA